MISGLCGQRYGDSLNSRHKSIFDRCVRKLYTDIAKEREKHKLAIAAGMKTVGIGDTSGYDKSDHKIRSFEELLVIAGI